MDALVVNRTGCNPATSRCCCAAYSGGQEGFVQSEFHPESASHETLCLSVGRIFEIQSRKLLWVPSSQLLLVLVENIFSDV